MAVHYTNMKEVSQSSVNDPMAVVVTFDHTTKSA